MKFPIIKVLIFLCVLCAVVFVVLCSADMGVTETKKTERYYQKKWCDAVDGRMEFVLKDRTRVDCLTKTHAVEVDFARKWYEFGQALHYAYLTKKKAGVLLIWKSERDVEHIKKLMKLIEQYDLPITLFAIEAE